MKSWPGVPLADRVRSTSAGGDRVVAAPIDEHQRATTARAASTADHRATAAAERTEAARRGAPRRRAVADGTGRSGHSSAILRRRTRTMNTGAADDRGDDADLELAGPGDDPADDVGAEQQHRREHHRVRQRSSAGRGR